MAYEIERKFLLLPIMVDVFIRYLKLKPTIVDIEQHYFERNNQIGRIRRLQDRYYITLKKGEGLVREEYEEEIDDRIFNNIISNVEKLYTIYKTRFILEIDSYTYEIDQFKGNLKGLVFLEVEFKSIEDADSFIIYKGFKDVIMKEVTNYKEYTNANLAITQKIPYLSDK